MYHALLSWGINLWADRLRTLQPLRVLVVACTCSACLHIIRMLFPCALVFASHCLLYWRIVVMCLHRHSNRRRNADRISNNRDQNIKHKTQNTTTAKHCNSTRAKHKTQNTRTAQHITPNKIAKRSKTQHTQYNYKTVNVLYLYTVIRDKSAQSAGAVGITAGVQFALC